MLKDAAGCMPDIFTCPGHANEPFGLGTDQITKHLRCVAAGKDIRNDAR